MLGIIRWVAAKIANYWDFASWLAAWLWTIGGGVVTGWAASAANLFPQYAPFSWVLAGLLGALIASLAAMCVGWLRYAVVKATAVAKWRDRVDSINPLDAAFHAKRISWQDIAHPISRKVERKRFTECDLLGPANIVMMGTGTVYGVHFFDCDIVVARPDAVLFNVIALENVEIIGGTMWRCTIIIPPEQVPTFQKQMVGNRFVTLTGVAELDNQPSAKP